MQTTFKLKADFDFSVRVSSSTPKNKREFACRLSFGRKFARNKRFMQYIECQWLIFDNNSFVMQKAPFRHAILPISEDEMLNIMPWYRRNRTMKRAISEREMNFSGPCFTVDDNANSYEPAFIVHDLTFLYISFAILFCQKKVKKNRKSVTRVLL